MKSAILALSVLVLAACDTDAVGRDLTTLRVGDLSHDADALVGTWRLSTLTGPGDCGPPCQQTVPASVRGVSETLTFRAGGTFEQVRTYQGGEWEDAGTYEVRRIDYGNGTQSKDPVLFLNDSPESFGLDGDRLYLDDRPVDGELLEYVRR